MICKRCNIDKDGSAYYKNKNRPNTLAYCKQCCTEQTLERQRKLKEMCVEYKGRKM